MIEVAYDTLTAWVTLLEGISVPVYKTSALPTNGNHVICRFESESTEQNNTAFMKNPVIIVEVVTHFINAINPKIGWDITNEIMARVFDTPGEFNVVYSKLGEIEEAGTEAIEELESNPIIYRIIKRFLNRTIQ